jgi:hypothetical protein
LPLAREALAAVDRAGEGARELAAGDFQNPTGGLRDDLLDAARHLATTGQSR